MSISSDEVRCTAHEGAVWMHFDELRVNIPSELLEKSKVLKNAVSSMAGTSIAKDFTLAAPKEWLETWVKCYCGEEVRVSRATNGDVINCILVCFCT
jgi:post-segregation antitoxin (ccd killing protein)